VAARSLPYLRRAGLEIDVVTLRTTPGPLDDEFLRADVRVTHIGTARRYRRFTVRLRQIIETDGPYQIVHSDLPYGGIQLRLAARLGIPVRIAHSHADMCPLQAKQSLKRRLLNRKLSEAERIDLIGKTPRSEFASATLAL